MHARKDVAGDDVGDGDGADARAGAPGRPRVVEDELTGATRAGHARVRCVRCADDGGVGVDRTRE